MKKSYVIIPLLSVIVIITGALVFITTAPTNTPSRITALSSSNVSSKIIDSSSTESVEETPSGDSHVLLADGSLVNDDLIVITTEGASATVKTSSPVYYESPGKNVQIPEFYQELEMPGMDTPIYGFVDNTGVTQIRVYGTRWSMENNIKADSVTGFFRQELVKTKSGVMLNDPGDPEPVKDTREKSSSPHRKSPAEGVVMPTGYFEIGENLYKCYDTNERCAYRTWAEVNGIMSVYPCGSDGIIKRGVIPVNYTEESSTLIVEDFVETSDEITRYPGIIADSITMTVK